MISGCSSALGKRELGIAARRPFTHFFLPSADLLVHSHAVQARPSGRAGRDPAYSCRERLTRCSPARPPLDHPASSPAAGAWWDTQATCPPPLPRLATPLRGEGQAPTASWPMHQRRPAQLQSLHSANPVDVAQLHFSACLAGPHPRKGLPAPLGESCIGPRGACPASRKGGGRAMPILSVVVVDDANPRPQHATY